ncbi:MAG: cation-transporting P-type ATPase [Nitrospirae bacterium]|nr:cation-transporting P-type ATPase [Nitrospirota bacterium]MBF0535971.1 cation-transporting P-type ATPase [Nitrospirota bacterium]MBF0618053.1 cation-transporting P-type ATPase [Nitrospirota bacterium]
MNTEPQVLTVLHKGVKGRIRFKIRGLSRFSGFKDYLYNNLSQNDEVISVTISALTENVLVIYKVSCDLSTLQQLVERLATEYGIRIPDLKTKQPLPLKKKKASKKVVSSELTEQPKKHWHTIAVEKVTEFFNTSLHHGLSNLQVSEGLIKYGPNMLPDSVKRSALSIFLGQLNSLPVFLLCAAAVISVSTGGIFDAAIVMSVVGINAVIGYLTESQAERTISALKNLVMPEAAVLREGVTITISCEKVVPGDILLLQPGTFVAADARILTAKHLSIDESALTGESMPVVKTPDVIDYEDIPLGDRYNMAYMGTTVTGGQAIAVVTATGRHTELGMIQSMVDSAESPETPMEKQLNVLGNQLVYISSGVCALVFVIGILRGYAFLRMLNTAISLAVAAVPEGLPTVATTTLSLGIKSLKQHGVLIRNLAAVETLGCCQTICFDKTGTITLNKMTTVAIHAGLKRIKVSDRGFTVDSQNINATDMDELRLLLEVCALCNETAVENAGGTYKLTGSPTESALVKAAILADIDVVSLRNEFPMLEVCHRSEARNCMSTMHELPQNRLNGHKKLYEDDEKIPVAVKGSPIEVLSMCSKVMIDGQIISLDDELRQAIENENEYMAGKALRILGVAWYNTDSIDPVFRNYNMVWLGLIGMIDPIRNGVKDVVKTFHNAGIDTIMITGDQSLTAYSIGKELGISRNGKLEIVDSRHLKDLEPDVLKNLCERVDVFARVTPAHKYQIVQALQQSGRVVAMTGDGINDGPALKAADIGIAMGKDGTDLAREVADVILENDDLSTMVTAIKEGRTIYGNIRKSIHFLLATNMSEIIVMFTTLATGLGQPLNTMQLLWINLATDIFPGLALALEPPEPDILSKQPRDPSEHILNNSDMKKLLKESSALSLGALAAYGYGLWRYGASPKANTLAFMTLTSGQLLHTLSCRSDTISIFDKERLSRNKYLDIAMSASFAAQILCVLVPPLRKVLGITPIGIADALVIAGNAVVPYLFNEKTKKG